MGCIQSLRLRGIDLLWAKAHAPQPHGQHLVCSPFQPGGLAHNCLRAGLFQSVRPAQWKLTLSADLSNSAFYEEVNVIEFVAEVSYCHIGYQARHSDRSRFFVSAVQANSSAVSVTMIVAWCCEYAFCPFSCRLQGQHFVVHRLSRTSRLWQSMAESASTR